MLRQKYRTGMERGFALIEAVLVLMIIAIFAIAALPRLNTTGTQVRTVSRQVMDDIRYTRTLAVTNGNDVTISFSGNQYVIDGSTTKVLPDGMTFANETPLIFTFHMRGHATLPAGGGSVTITKDGHSNTMSVTASTGMVKNEP